MFKGITLLVAGGILGAAALLLATSSSDDSQSAAGGAPSVLASVADALRGERSSQLSSPVVSVSDQLSAFQAAADESDPASLRRSLESAAGAPPSLARDLEVDALLARLSELAPAQAARLALALQLESRFIADAYAYWAETDVDAALAGLAEIESRMVRRDVVLTLLDVFENDNRALERVAAALPESERNPILVEGLARRAEYDPFGALRETLALRNLALQRTALTEIASAWAGQDPLGAISQADLLPGDLRSGYLVSVVSEWARLDGAGFLSYLQGAVSPPQESVAGVRFLVASDPEGVLQAAEGILGTVGEMLRASALSALADLDPDAAMARAATWPPGPDRERMLQSIASALGRRDPAAAIAWAESLSPPSPNVLRSVMLAIAQTDPDRMLEFIDSSSPLDSQLLLSMSLSQVARNPEQAETLAEKLISRNDLQSKNALRSLVSSWMGQDPERALDWVLAHGADVDGSVLGAAAQTLARRDPAAAAAYVDRLPAEHRVAWITSVAGAYGLYDSNGAIAWISQFQGQDLYDVAFRQIIVTKAQADPRAAAQLLAQASPDVQLGAALQVASRWAQQEPRAAASWAEELNDPRARSNATTSVVSVWAMNDPAAAARWTLTLQSGETRDQALSMLLTRSASAGQFDRNLLSSFSSDQQRQQALRGAIPMLARNDPEQARELLESEVTDRNLRVQIEEMIEQQSVAR